MTDPDLLDGCDLDFTVDPTPDGAWQIGWVLFASVDVTDLAAVERHRHEWEVLFDA